MAELTIQKITRSGLNFSTVSANAGGDNFVQAPEANVFLYVDNQDASAKEVTVTAANTSKIVPGYGSLSASSAVVSVPAGEQRMIGPFPFGVFESDVAITYDAVTSLSVAAIRLPRNE